MLRNTFACTRKGNVVKLNTHRQKRLKETEEKRQEAQVHSRWVHSAKKASCLLVCTWLHSTLCIVQRVCALRASPCSRCKCAMKMTWNNFCIREILNEAAETCRNILFFFVEFSLCWCVRSHAIVHCARITLSASFWENYLRLNVWHTEWMQRMWMCTKHLFRPNKIYLRLMYVLGFECSVLGTSAHRFILHSTVQVQPNTFSCIYWMHTESVV